MVVIIDTIRLEMIIKLVYYSVLTLTVHRAIIIKSPRGDANSKPAGAAWERKRKEDGEKITEKFSKRY